MICDKRGAVKEKGNMTEGSETSSVVWFGDGGPDQKTEGRVNDVVIHFASDEDGRD